MPHFRVAVLTVAVLALPALAQPTWPPDQKKANIGGKEGMLWYPVDEQKERLEFRDCVVQFAPENALEKRITYPCGEWFLPPPGRYRCWIEHDGRVSGLQSLLRDSGEAPFLGSGFMVQHHTIPAGSVAAAQPVPAGHTVRYLHLDQPGTGFQIRVPASAAMKPSLMPPGKVFAAIYKESSDEAVALTRPINVEPGKTTEVRLQPPAKGSDLLVILRKFPGAPPRMDSRIRVQNEAVSRAPDVLHEAPGWIVAAWYGLPAGTVMLSVAAEGTALPETKVELPEAKVTTIRRELVRAK